MFTITLQGKDTEPQVLQFDKSEITIGRLSSADIQLKANNVSKQHSRIVYREGRYFIIDRKSTNGTFVNGNRVSVPMSLKNGDKVFIGDFTLEFEGVEDARKVTEPPEGESAQAERPSPPPLPRDADTVPPDLPGPSDTAVPKSALPDVTAEFEAQDSLDQQLDEADLELVEDEDAESGEGDDEDFRELCFELYVAAGDFEEFADLESFVEYRLDDDEHTKLVRAKLNALIDELAPENLTQAMRESAVQHLLGELLGYGALEDYLTDDEVDEIFINGPDTLVLRKGGKREMAPDFFSCEEALFNVVVRLLEPYRLLLQEESAVLNATVGEFSITGVLHPFAINGSSLRIAKTPVFQETLDSLVEGQVVSEAMSEFLGDAVAAGKRICVTGANESDRLNVMAALAQLIPTNARVALFNVGSALELPHRDQVQIEGSAGDVLESELTVDSADLLRNIERLKIDRLVLRDVTETFAAEFLFALNAGVEGALFTCFGKGCSDALARLRRMSGYEGSSKAYVDELIAANIDITVNVTRYKNGESRVNCICDVNETKDGWDLKQRFGFEPKTDTADALVGEFKTL